MEFCIFLKIWIKIQTAETTGDFIANKIINKITRLSKNLQQNNSEVDTYDRWQIYIVGRYISNERYISGEEKQKLLMKWD